MAVKALLFVKSEVCTKDTWWISSYIRRGTESASHQARSGVVRVGVYTSTIITGRGYEERKENEAGGETCTGVRVVTMVQRLGGASDGVPVDGG